MKQIQGFANEAIQQGESAGCHSPKPSNFTKVSVLKSAILGMLATMKPAKPLSGIQAW